MNFNGSSRNNVEMFIVDFRLFIFSTGDGLPERDEGAFEWVLKKFSDWKII